MKQTIAMLLCLLLLGCARQVPPDQGNASPEPAAVLAGLYDPDHPMERNHPGLVRAYPLTLQKVQGLRTLGKDVLVMSGQDSTTLTLFTGDDLYETASLTLDFPLDQEDPSLQIDENGISFFDPIRQETVILDHRLQEIRRITGPDGLSGKPLLSSGRDTLYYCTAWAVMAWDLESGIRRTVKELSYDIQELTALHLDGQILECTIRDEGLAAKLLLTSDLGLEVESLPENAMLHTENNRYFATLTSGYQTMMIFGNTDDSPQLLLPDQSWQQQFYLPEDHAAVTVCPSEAGIRLDYYELNTGILRSSLTLETTQTLKSIVNSKGHSIYILACDSEEGHDILYRWDVLRQPPDPSNVTTYKSDYHGLENPDLEGLEACRNYAKTIGEKYGIRVRIWEDAVAVQPWDYRFEPEYLVAVLQKELELLDQRLARYPENVLQQTKAHFTDLTLCLVRQITGTGDARSLSTATGIQFFSENEAYVVITTGKYSEQALYHELYHVMETHILTESAALDPWESLNPTGFAYGSNQQNTDIYLQGQTRAFVDRYSMSSLKEDRARFLENAMLTDKRDTFQSEYMQRKLKALCLGLREAYGLKKYPDPLPWEQYLVTSLVPTE